MDWRSVSQRPLPEALPVGQTQNAQKITQDTECQVRQVKSTGEIAWRQIRVSRHVLTCLDCLDSSCIILSPMNTTGSSIIHRQCDDVTM